MNAPKSLRALAVAAPVAVAAVLASAPLAGAAVGDAGMTDPHVIDQGNKLAVTLGSTVSNDAADNAMARAMTERLVGGWAGDLVDYAVRNNTPAQAQTCRATVTAIDPDGAAGTASALVPTGASNMELDIVDQAAGTKWAVGDVDHFTLQFTCTGAKQAGNMAQTILDEDQIAA